MKHRNIRLIGLLLAVLFCMTAICIPASAAFTVGTTISGIGTIVSSTDQTVAEGLTYTHTVFTDAKGYGQTMYAMEFNPTTTGYMPITYQPQPSIGSKVDDTVAAAKAEGYEVLGAINGEFGSMNPENWGTLDGRLITNGRIVADSEYCENICLAIDSDGNFQLTNSRISYHFYVEGKEILNAESGDPVIGSINKRYVGTNWWSPFCYFDYETGGATYTHKDVPGVEVVFNKTDGTELMVEGILQGEVVSVNTNAFATPMTENQFVLYAQNGTSNYDALANLQAGQKVQIYAEELITESKDIMKNAVSVTSATYPIVVDGVDNTDYTPNATDIYLTPAQRTAIGVKADGTMVFLCVDGRGESETNNKGITLPMLAELMISLGCQYAVNLDGGGSTTMCVGDENVITYGRAVSSSILICKRNDTTTSPAEKAALKTVIDTAAAGSYVGEQQTLVNAALTEANAVYNDDAAFTGSMTGDFTREKMDLLSAMGVITSVKPKNYISLDANDWSYNSSIMVAQNDADGALILNNTNGQWPSAQFGCEATVNASDHLYFDITVNGQSSVVMTINGNAVNLNAMIAPDSLDSGSGDIVGGGKTFKGSIPVSEICAGGGTLTNVTLWAVGGAGDPSKVTVRELTFRNPYSGGDINGSGAVDSSDARLLMRYIVNKITLTDIQIVAADANGDGTVDSNDARYILQKRVGLI